MAENSATMDTHAHQARFDKFLGFETVHVEPGLARVKMVVRPESLQGQGVAHGGVLATLADSAFFQALRLTLHPGESALTVELKVNYLSPGRPGETLICEAKLVQRGGRIVVGTMEVYEESSHRLVLTGLGTYMVNRPRAGKEQAPAP